MLRPRMLIALMVFLLGATGVAIASRPASAQEQTPSTAATDTPIVRKRGHVDPKTPAPRSGTLCDVRVTKSTVTATIDRACLTAITAARFTPELKDGAPVEDSTGIAIYW
jgi:hypothetical protein